VVKDKGINAWDLWSHSSAAYSQSYFGIEKHGNEYDHFESWIKNSHITILISHKALYV